MIIVVCVDDHMGMSFCGKRQSSDRLLRQDLLRYAAKRPVWMDFYSAQQFSDCDQKLLHMDDDCLVHAPAGSLCFVERQDLSRWPEQIEGVILYHWHRSYPASVRFELPLDDFICTETIDFPGYSHENITREVYRRET